MKKVTNLTGATHAELSKDQSGFSILEAVVALAIFSVGVLGLAALQLNSLVSTGDSQQRTLAIWKAQELADRIRANSEHTDLYINTVANDGTGSIGADSAAGLVDCAGGSFAKPAASCADSASDASSGCDQPEDKVAYDLWEVLCQADTGLGVAATSTDDVAAGSQGLANLEVAMRRDGDDVLLGVEWLSRESDGNQAVRDAADETVQLCGVDNVQVSPSVDVYCLRFRP